MYNCENINYNNIYNVLPARQPVDLCFPSLSYFLRLQKCVVLNAQQWNKIEKRMKQFSCYVNPTKGRYNWLVFCRWTDIFWAIFILWIIWISWDVTYDGMIRLFFIVYVRLTFEWPGQFNYTANINAKHNLEQSRAGRKLLCQWFAPAMLG